MTFASKAASVLGYRVLPTTILALVSYLVVFLALGITDRLPNVPKQDKQGGLDVMEAFEDLQHITAHPHPFNSHANDKAHSYILSRLSQVASEYPHVHIVNDLTSNASFLITATAGVYFEGTNILVKIDGTSGFDNGAVLFSAHYDSVATAPGVTDDGMGLVTLMQLVRCFAQNRMPRTAVFNLNNGEEDGLHGAHMFLEHPWSNLTDSFLNLEGAAAGGRPILFRATSASPVRAARNAKHMPHPNANVVSSDAFSRRFIRSGTDFTVYAGPGSRAGMAGLDLAFYKGRSMYHTKYDSVQYTVGGKKSLWSMMEASRGIGIGLLSAPFEDGKQKVKDNDDPVYFDLFKSLLIVFRLKSLLKFNIILLVVGPILLLLLVFFERFFLRRKDTEHVAQENTGPRSPAPPAPPTRNGSNQESHPHLRYFHRPSSSSMTAATGGGTVSGAHSELRNENSAAAAGNDYSHVHRHWAIEWVHVVWRHAKFWVALLVVFALQALLIWGYVAVNPFAIYSSPYIILFSFLSLAYLTLIYTLTLPTSLPFYHPKGYPVPNHYLLRPAQEQKQTIFFHFYAFTWLLLVLATLGITRVTPGIGGGYLISVWNALLGVSCVLCVLEAMFTGTAWRNGEEADAEVEGELPQPLHRHVEDADETTPLIWRRDESSGSRRANDYSAEDDEEVHIGGSLGTWWWIPQFLVSVPIPVILWGQVAMLLLDAMPQTLADGGRPVGVYALTALTAVLLVLPLAPFAYKLRPYRPLSLLVVLIFVLTTLYAWLRFPFSIEAPLKLFFQQRVEFPEQHIGFAAEAAASAFPVLYTPKLITALSGPEMYIRTAIIPHFPSAREGGKTITCRSDTLRTGLLRCEWESGARMMPFPGTDAQQRDSERWANDQFFKAHVERTGRTTAQIRIKGQNTRSCRVYFDSNPINEYTVWPARRPLGHRGPRAGDVSAKHSGGMQEGYEVGPHGVKQVILWSRTWDREFGLDVDWSAFVNETSDSMMRGRVACNWSEYESGVADNGALMHNGTGVQGRLAWADAANTQLVRDRRPKIPAYEEALTFLPDWTTVTKYDDGVVEVLAPFVI